jgi:mono/diheme cytochrome c family protein
VLLASVAAAAGAEPLAFYGFDPKAYSPTAQEGLQEIFAGRIFNFGMPAAAARMLLVSQTNFKKDLGLEPGSREAIFYALGRLPSPPDRVDGADAHFGLGESALERNGSAQVSFNCFGCHAGVVNGQVVAGLGNSHINQSRPNQVRARGDNYGPYEVWRLGARFADPEKEGMTIASKTTELQALIDSLELPPVDPMPWWTMKYKRMNYWYGDGGSHNAANFSLNFTVPSPDINERRAEHVARVAKALAFARETQSPPYPGSLDASLVRQGADLFHGRTPPAVTTGFRACKTCHGTYTKKSDQADWSRPGAWQVAYDFSDVLRNVRTDEAYNATLKKLGPVADNINKLAAYFTAQGKPELAPHALVPQGDGYVAPPLVGVWASAPYFHNGSVPTIEAVLNSSLRPEIWARNNRDPQAYDLEHVGMAYRALSRSDFEASAAAASGKPFLSTAAIDHSSAYDTTQYGHKNTGHTFGDRLSDHERRAIIEFLKSLSGPDM